MRKDGIQTRKRKPKKNGSESGNASGNASAAGSGGSATTKDDKDGEYI